MAFNKTGRAGARPGARSEGPSPRRAHGRLNQEEKEDMARFVLDVNQEWGTTIILIEHDMGVVMDISDRVAVLDMGQKIAQGTPDEVRANPQVIKAYSGDAKARDGRAGDAPRLSAQRAGVRESPGHPREGSRDLADVDVARVPGAGARPRPRPGRARLPPGRPPVRHRRQPAAALLGPGGRPVPRRRARARVPGLDRQRAGVRLEPRRDQRDRRGRPGAGRQGAVAARGAARPSPRDL